MYQEAGREADNEEEKPVNTKGWEIAEMVKLADQDVKTIIMFKCLKENRNRTRREVEDIKKEQMERLEIKTIQYLKQIFHLMRLTTD